MAPSEADTDRSSSVCVSMKTLSHARRLPTIAVVRSAHRNLIRAAAQNKGKGFAWSYLMQMRGSIFPAAIRTAVPCALLASMVKLLMTLDLINWDRAGVHVPLREYAAWSGFSFLVGFLVVFRTSQAYNRFWSGCSATHRMRAEWYEACCGLVAFSSQSKCPEIQRLHFRNLVVRLFSMLHAMALAELEDNHDRLAELEAFTYEVIDVEGIDSTSLQTLKASSSKAELVFLWIQSMILTSVGEGLVPVPPPILTRVFQNLGNGRIAFNDALQITSIPFPFPYAQTCDCLLVIHWVVSPIVVSQWVSHWSWAFIFTFIQVFILWALNFIALEIQNPFGMDMNDLDCHELQAEMNQSLLVLLTPEIFATPKLSQGACLRPRGLGEHGSGRASSLSDVWHKGDAPSPDRSRSRSRSTRSGSPPIELVAMGSQLCFGDEPCPLEKCGLKEPSGAASRSREHQQSRGAASRGRDHRQSVEDAGLRDRRSFSEDRLPPPVRPNGSMLVNVGGMPLTSSIGASAVMRNCGASPRELVIASEESAMRAPCEPSLSLRAAGRIKHAADLARTALKDHTDSGLQDNGALDVGLPDSGAPNVLAVKLSVQAALSGCSEKLERV